MKSLRSRAQYRFFTPVTTRWADADPLGHINNAMLVRYIECGRIDYFQQLCGVSLSASDQQGFVLANLEIAFLRELHHPNLLEVASRVSRLGNSSFDVDGSIFQSGADAALTTTTAVCVWFDFVHHRSQTIPESIRRRIIEFEQLCDEP